MNTDIGFIWASPMLYKLDNENFPLTHGDRSLIGAMMFYGKVVGPLISLLLMDRIGRKKLLIFLSIINTLQWIPLCLCKTIPAILMSRFLVGVIDAAYIPLSVVYIAENSYPSIRGSFISSLSVCHSLGHILAYAIILYLDFYTAHLAFFIITSLSSISMFFIVESPEFLATKARFDEAEIAYFKIRSKSCQADTEYFSRIVNHCKNKSGGVIDSARELCKSQASREGFKIMMIIHILLFIGISVGPLNAFSTILISRDLDRNTVTVLIYLKTSVYIVASFFSAFLGRKFKRRTIAMTGFSVSIVSMLGCAFVYILDAVGGNRIPRFSYYIFALLTLEESSKAAFVVPWISCIKGELLPQHTKSVILAMTLSGAAFISAIHTNTFWWVAIKAGNATNFFISSIALFFLMLYVQYYLPETSGKTLIDIEHELGSGEKNVDLELKSKPVNESFNTGELPI